MKDQEDETVELSYGGELDEDQKKKDEAKDLIIEILENGGKGTKEILELTKKQVGNKNVRTALSELVKDGLIVLGKQGRQNFYSLTEEKTEYPLSNF
jgi:predicted transcriptional regulator